MRVRATSLAWLLSASVAIGATLDASLIQTSGLPPPVGSGMFYGYRTSSEGPGRNAFSNAYEKAVSEGVPLVVIWSNEGCDHCDAFIAELNNNRAEVASWLRSHEAVFTFFKDYSKTDEGKDANPSPGHEPAACYDAWYFATKTCKAKAVWPLFGFYYKKGASNYDYWGTRSSMGSGRTWLDFKTEYEDWIASRHITSYRGAEFAASGTTYDRYEAEPSTEYVDVELVRASDKAAYAYTNRLTAVRPDESAAWRTTNVAWAVSETTKTVRVSLVRAEGEAFREGQMTLRLYDQNGNLHATNPVFCRTEMENSNANPLWIGARNVEELAWGEWTMDLDVATNKVAAAEGPAYTLVSVQGSRWCPDCGNVDRNFMDVEDDEGNNRFRAWAMSNNIALVAIDIPNYNGPTVDDCASPSLLSRTAYANAIARAKEWPASGADAALTNKMLRSGRPYLSRKMVSVADADAIRVRNHFLVSTNTPFGGFHRPEDTNKNRTGVPIFVLLRKDGTVAARMTRFASVSPMAAERAKWDDFIRRFDEMLEIASSDAAEIENNHWTTTKAVLSSAKPIVASVSHVDTVDVAEIAAVSGGAHLKLSLAGESTNAVTLEIVSVTDGVSRTLASAYGPLGGLSVEADLAGANQWFASVSCANTAAGFMVGASSSTFAAYTLSAECYIRPLETSETFVPDGDSVVIRVVEGECYRFAGLVLPAEDFEDAGDGLHRATRSADLTLSLAEGATSVTYQLWHPGEIKFVQSEQIVYTRMGDASLAVTRTGGVSGQKTETVRLLSADEHAEGRYVWKDVDVVWEDGEGGEKAVVLEIVPPGDEVRSTGALMFGVGDSQLVVTLLDSDSPGLVLLDYSAETYQYFSSGISLPAVNLLSGNHVSVRVLSGSLPSGTRLAYDEESGEVRLLGEPVSSGDYAFDVALAEIREGRYVVGPASTVRVRVEEVPSSANPYLAEARPSETLLLYVDRNGTCFVAGTLSVAITSRGRISARYMGTEARSAAFSGSWQELDKESGRVSAVLTKNGCSLELTMDASGTLSACLRVPSEFSYFAEGEAEFVMTAEAAWPKQDSFGDYRGFYNVVLPIAGASRPDAPCGMGIIALRMTSDSAVAAGRFSYSGFMPDGTPINGSATAIRHLANGENFIWIPVFKRIGKHFFSAVFAIRPKASENWNSLAGAPMTWVSPIDLLEYDMLEREVVQLASGTMAFSVHRDAAWEYEIRHDMAVGSYYVQGISPLELTDTFYAELYENPVKYGLRIAADGVESPMFGKLSAPAANIVPGIDTMTMETKITGMSFKLAPRNGMFTGSAVLTFSDETGKRKKVTGSYRGLLTPGWVRTCKEGCGISVFEWYFGSGFIRYRDFNDEGRAVLKSIPVTLSPPDMF